MAALFFFLAATLLASLKAFDLGQSTRCVAIPNQMKVCKDVGYSEMRLPNFLGHSNLEAEVVPRSEDWRPLLQTGCHPQAQAFLCSLIAPVCLDTFIQPCRSLCMAVRDSCAPVLACQGHPWPQALDCDRLPAEEDMCLSPHAKFSQFAKDLPKAACQNCPAVEEAPAMKTVLDAFCQHDFAVTAKLRRRRLLTGEPEFEVEGRVEFIRQGPLLPYDTHHLLHQWLLINLRCANTMVRPGRLQLYVLTGSVRSDGTVTIARLFPWHKKDANIAVATRKWKHHRC
ncbi:sizzled [Corythoichthys intestinalis]|uniref:sizzled n=1 Tax=Corythoichthys intestinalis TaxID=161448 RepID=UPI0025A5AF45|nr:sizzled [Corythoichthys intestinalis]XP_057693100.1 sizzled [Corythoichthys intestinalis]XP_061812499.1 secreted frizzled-related protein 5-like [Nerophis lumbriciformis]